MPARGARARRAADERGGVFFKLLVFLAVVTAFAALAWMLFLPMVVTAQIRARTGFDAKVKRLSVNPFGGSVELSGFVLTNPPTFPEQGFIQLREFSARARLFSLFSERPVFDRMDVDIEAITLVKRADGTTNAEAFQQNLEGAQPPRPPSLREPARQQFLIHDLRLRLDRLTVADHSGRTPKVQAFELHIDQSYKEVTDLKQLLEPKVLQGLAPVALAVSGLVPGEMGRALNEAAKTGAAFLKEAGRQTGAAVKGFFDALEESKKP